MKRVELIASQLTDKEHLHDTLLKELELPEWYGRNLDALYDCLTELTGVELVLIGWPDEDAIHFYEEATGGMMIPGGGVSVYSRMVHLDEN